MCLLATRLSCQNERGSFLGRFARKKQRMLQLLMFAEPTCFEANLDCKPVQGKGSFDRFRKVSLIHLCLRDSRACQRDQTDGLKRGCHSIHLPQTIRSHPESSPRSPSSHEKGSVPFLWFLFKPAWTLKLPSKKGFHPIMLGYNPLF